MIARHQRKTNERNLRRQGGVASLTVVMVLFFIMSLVAAYTSRNLIFEQRTSGNQYRSTQAFEAAEAGIEWALSMLNSGRIDTACAASTNVADSSFRLRHLNVDATNGNVTPVLRTNDPTLVPSPPLEASCVFNGSAWQCSCPVNDEPSLTVPTGAGSFPAFRIRFVVPPGAPVPGLIRLESNGCTRADEDCLKFEGNPQSGAGDGRASVSTLIALKSGLVAPPIAALTVRGDFTLDPTAGLKAVNADNGAGGISVLSGGARPPPSTLQRFGAPGTPGEQTVIDGDINLFNMRDTGGRPPTDPGFEAELRDGRMFASVFGTWPETYRTQPAAVELTCAGGDCTAAQVRTTISLNPGRVIWVLGNLVLGSAGDIGSPSDPVVLAVAGNISNPSNVDVFGVVYSRAETWITSGGGTVRGAAVAEGGLGGDGTSTFVYDAGVLEMLRLRTGSFVRVPGSWKDFE